MWCQTGWSLIELYRWMVECPLPPEISTDGTMLACSACTAEYLRRRTNNKCMQAAVGAYCHGFAAVGPGWTVILVKEATEAKSLLIQSTAAYTVARTELPHTTHRSACGWVMSGTSLTAR